MIIQRKYPDILTAWHGLVRELAYEPERTDALNWGMHAAFPEIAVIEITDALKDDGLNLEMSSYTKTRWTSFLRRYFRPDFPEWIDGAMKRLENYRHRPYVSAYSINVETPPPPRKTGRNFSAGGGRGHNYGSCLGSLQLRINPRPQVILYSRACAIDKTGFLDLSLIHLTAKRMGREKVGATWVISLGFISAISELFYTHRFKQPVKGHSLEKRMTHLLKTGSDHNYGPLKRILARRKQASDSGAKVKHAYAVKDLSLEFETLDKRN